MGESLSPSEQILRYFEFEHLPSHLRQVSELVSILARDVDSMIPDGPEKTFGLRQLLLAKDAFVRASLRNEGQ